MTSTDATACHDTDPPDTVGTDGAVRSSRTVDAADTAVQAEAFPAVSTARASTSVSPSADTATVAPEAAAPQVAPPSVETRCS